MYELVRNVYVDEGKSGFRVPNGNVGGGELCGVVDPSLWTFLQDVPEIGGESDTPSDHVLLKVSIVLCAMR